MVVWFGSFRKAILAAGLTPRPHGLRMDATPNTGRRRRHIRRPILDPRWPVIFAEARRQLDRESAA